MHIACSGFQAVLWDLCAAFAHQPRHSGHPASLRWLAEPVKRFDPIAAALISLGNCRGNLVAKQGGLRWSSCSHSPGALRLLPCLRLARCSCREAEQAIGVACLTKTHEIAIKTSRARRHRLCGGRETMDVRKPSLPVVPWRRRPAFRSNQHTCPLQGKVRLYFALVQAHTHVRGCRCFFEVRTRP